MLLYTEGSQESLDGLYQPVALQDMNNKTDNDIFI